MRIKDKRKFLTSIIISVLIIVSIILIINIRNIFNSERVKIAKKDLAILDMDEEREEDDDDAVDNPCENGHKYVKGICTVCSKIETTDGTQKWDLTGRWK